MIPENERIALQDDRHAVEKLNEIIEDMKVFNQVMKIYSQNPKINHPQERYENYIKVILGLVNIAPSVINEKFKDASDSYTAGVHRILAWCTYIMRPSEIRLSTKRAEFVATLKGIIAEIDNVPLGRPLTSWLDCIKPTGDRLAELSRTLGWRYAPVIFRNFIDAGSGNGPQGIEYQHVKSGNSMTVPIGNDGIDASTREEILIVLREWLNHAEQFAQPTTLPTVPPAPDCAAGIHSPIDLYTELGISSRLFSKLVKDAGVVPPKHGGGGHRFTDAEREKIFRYAAEKGRSKKTRDNAKAALAKRKETALKQ